MKLEGKEYDAEGAGMLCEELTREIRDRVNNSEKYFFFFDRLPSDAIPTKNLMISLVLFASHDFWTLETASWSTCDWGFALNEKYSFCVVGLSGFFF